MTTDEKIMRAGRDKLGIVLGKTAVEMLAAYHDMVIEWNQRINLVSRRDVDNLVERHIIDSLAPLCCWDRLELPEMPEVMDLGAGGGFPGIPLKICRPEIQLTCVEATQKKARFIETAARELGLQKVTVVARHSDVINKEGSYKLKYDLVICRAVAELKDLVEISFPFLKTGGLLLAYKGQKAEGELMASELVLKKMGGRVEESETYGAGTERKIIVIRKQR